VLTAYADDTFILLPANETAELDRRLQNVLMIVNPSPEVIEVALRRVAWQYTCVS
jgi:hypothetical protein